MMAAKGDPFYHSSIYMGKGKLADAYDFEKGISNDTPLFGDVAEGVRAYRPKSGQKEALDYARKMKGTAYGSDEEILRHGFEHLLGNGKKSGVCGPDGQVCTQFVANAYPELFPDQYASPATMRHAKDLELIARYEPIQVAKREKILSRLVYPLLKNAKYGLGAGALAYGGSKLAKYLSKNEKDEP
jgi:hypothetical protein